MTIASVLIVVFFSSVPLIWLGRIGVRKHV